MALSDLAVFNETLFSLVTEILDQQVELFNAASAGGIVLASKPFGGDFSDTSFFAAVSGIVRRRNPYATGAIAQKSLRTLIETMVKVAAGTFPLNMDPGQFNWIKENPELAGAVWAKQMAPQVLADMLGIAISAVTAALSQVAANVNDKSAVANSMTNANLVGTQALLGDRASEVTAWIMHSTQWFKIIQGNLTNGAQLFKYDTVKIMADPLGTPYIVSDQPGLVKAGTPNTYTTLGLTAGGVAINTNDDYDQMVVEAIGDENLKRAMQAEWSYNVGVKGFTWDKANGGHAPNDAALATATNWDQIATSHRDLAGVLLISQ